jgi:hypothetical protein
MNNNQNPSVLFVAYLVIGFVVLGYGLRKIFISMGWRLPDGSSTPKDLVVLLALTVGIFLTLICIYKVYVRFKTAVRTNSR